MNTPKEKVLPGLYRCVENEDGAILLHRRVEFKIFLLTFVILAVIAPVLFVVYKLTIAGRNIEALMYFTSLFIIGAIIIRANTTLTPFTVKVGKDGVTFSYCRFFGGRRYTKRKSGQIQCIQPGIIQPGGWRNQSVSAIRFYRNEQNYDELSLYTIYFPEKENAALNETIKLAKIISSILKVKLKEQCFN